MTKYCEICKKEMSHGEFITHMVKHNEKAILIAILEELIELNGK